MFPNFLLIPWALIGEILEGLQGVTDAEARRKRDARGQGLDTLTLPVLEQSPDVDGPPLGLTSEAEVRHEEIGVVPEPMESPAVEWRCLGAIHALR
jgi:hypothetical protein